MANIKLKRISSDRKVKFIETPSGVFNLATGEPSKFDCIDASTGALLKPIYKSEDFIIDNYTNNTQSDGKVNNDIRIHGPVGKFKNIIQFDGYSLANKEESLSGVSTYNYSSEQYDFDNNGVSIYSPNENTQEYYESLENVDHMLLNKDYAHMSEIPLNDKNLDYEEGVLYADSTTLKNEKNQNYDVDAQVNFENIYLKNTRYYNKMGINNDNIWQSYKVGKNYTNNLILKENIKTLAQLPINGSLYASVLSGERIYYSGKFTRVGGYLRNNFFAINEDGDIQDISFKENSTYLNLNNFFIFKLIETSNYYYILGRYNTSYEYIYNLIKVDKSGNLIKIYINDNYINDFIIDNNNMYVVGNFTQFEGYLRNYIVCIDLNTDTLIPTFNPSFAKFLPDAYFNLESIVKINDELFVTYNDVIYIIQPNNDVNYYIYSFNNTNRTEGIYVSADNFFITNNNFLTLKAKIYNTAPYQYLQKYNIDGTLDNNFLLSANNRINDFVINDGNIYFVGDFTTVNETTRNYAACIDSNGVLQSWNPDLNAPGSVIETSGNYLYIGGSFSTISGGVVSTSGAFNIDTNGYLGNFNPTFSEISANVRSISFSGENIVIGLNKHYLTSSVYMRNGINVYDNINALKTTFYGSSSLVDYLSSNGNIFKILHNNNDTYCARSYGIDISGNLLKLTYDGANYNQDLDFIYEINNNVNSIAIINDTLYLGGNFTTIRSTTQDQKNRNYLASINLTTKIVNDFTCDCNGEVKTLEAYGNALYIGGEFTIVSGLNFRRFAILDTINNTLSNKNIKSYNGITALLNTGINIYTSNLSGTYLSAELNTNIGKFSANGNYFNEFDVTTGLNAINSIDFDASNVYLVGNFISVNSNATKKHFAKVDGNTGTLQSLTLSANDIIYDIEVSGNNIYLYGDFTEISGTPINYLAGYVDATLRSYNNLNLAYSPASVNPFINTKYLNTFNTSNNIYVLNADNIISGYTRNSLFATDLRGNITNWNPNVFTGTYSQIVTSQINDIKEYNEYLYCATNALSYQGLIKIHIDGTIDSDFTAFMKGISYPAIFPGFTTFNTVNSLAITGSTLYFAGDLTYPSYKNLFVIDDLDDYTAEPR